MPCKRFGKPKLGKKVAWIWQAKCEGLASFGSQPNNSQNHGLPNLWFGKFWKPTNQALSLFIDRESSYTEYVDPVHIVFC
jgi:hypothetical protein